MPELAIHLVHANISQGWNWPRIRSLFKAPVSGHLMKQPLLRLFTVSDMGRQNGNKYAQYYTASTVDRREYTKSQGIAGLQASFDYESWRLQAGSGNIISAYAAWGNLYNSGWYCGCWDARAAARVFPQPPATDSFSSGRYRGLTHLRSLSVTVSNYSVAAGAHARLGVILSDTTTIPNRFADIQAAPHADVTGNGTFRVDVHQAGKAYIILVAYFRDLEPPDEDGYQFNWFLNRYATAQFGIPSTAVAEYETEGEARQYQEENDNEGS